MLLLALVEMFAISRAFLFQLSPGSRDDWRAYIVNLNPPIKARYLRINPVYWKPEGYACIRTEVLTCSADEGGPTNDLNFSLISAIFVYYMLYFCLLFSVYCTQFKV